MQAAALAAKRPRRPILHRPVAGNLGTVGFLRLRANDSAPGDSNPVL